MREREWVGSALGFGIAHVNDLQDGAEVRGGESLIEEEGVSFDEADRVRIMVGCLELAPDGERFLFKIIADDETLDLWVGEESDNVLGE